MRKWSMMAVAVAILVLGGSTVIASESQPASASLGYALASEVNAYRQSQGLPPLIWDARIYEAARKHDDLMAQRNTVSHQLPGEPDFMQRIVNEGVTGLSSAGETIAAGNYDAARTRQQWTDSAPHKAIMKGDFTSIGCELQQYPGTTYGSLATCDYAAATPPMPPVVSGNIIRYLFYMPVARDGIVEATREVCGSQQLTGDGRYQGQVGAGCYFYGTTADNQPPGSKTGWAYVKFRDFTPYYRNLDARLQSLMPGDGRYFKRTVTPIPGF
ncbi:MAG: CAP domain-containing protein [Anaerolineae bacterium]